jgi:general L-amino acid transport system permease protein
MAEEISISSQLISPPTERLSPLKWAKRNLFSTWLNGLLTILTLGLIFILLRSLVAWILTQAQWEVVAVNIRLFMVGQYPADLIWRVWFSVQLLSAVIGLTWGVWVRGRRLLAILLLLVPLLLAAFPGLAQSTGLTLLTLDVVALVAFGLGRLGGSTMRRTTVVAWLLYFPLLILIISGLTPDAGSFASVPTNLWGGLLLTFLLTVVGILFSFPLGVLLALGRRSQLPIVRWVSIAYIEIIRGVPLVTILFMASNIVPLFLPTGMHPNLVLRAMLGITLFSAAYLAENVRGGLQAIPAGQYEAAQALGLNGYQTMVRIILPQALRIVIPPIVGQFISLFKDTSLVVTIGLLDLLGIARSVLAQPQYVSRQREVFLFITLIYWVFSYFMAYISQRLEIVLGVGKR